jgi:hypothetical protein
MHSTSERWEAKEEVLEALGRFERMIANWRCPRLFGLGLQTDSEEDIWFPYICHGDHPLPAAVLAVVRRHPGGTPSHKMTPEQLDDAVNQLAPAEACRDYDHPNLAAWRSIQDALTDHRPRIIAAVFDDVPKVGSSDPYVRTLRQAAGES